MNFASLWPVNTLRSRPAYKTTMQKPLGTPENKPPQANADTVGYAAGRTPARFTYASGSTPLTGFTIKRGIGMGGFGEVYYAVSDAGKEVALKRIQRNLDVELRGVRQCLNLKHTNLLSVHDIRFDDEGQAWIVMEYVPGESMQDVIQRNPNGLPWDEVHRWFDGLLAGVGHLHTSGIVHRDLKPGNIFMDGGVVKIGDYGLSKFISCSRRSGQTQSVGTFHYMAPEIGLGRYGKEIDIYALGIMLYELISGHVPYDGESSQEIIMKHLTAQPDLSKIASPYREVIQKSLAKDPEQRFSSVSEIQAMLAGDAPVLAEPLEPVASAIRPVATTISGAATPPHDEPILRALTTMGTEISNALSELGMPLRIFVIIVGIVLIATFLLPLAGLAIPLLLFYTVYFFIRTVALGSRHSVPRHAQAASLNAEVVKKPIVATAVVEELPRHQRHRAWPYKRKYHRSLRVRATDLKPFLSKKTGLLATTELFGSFLRAALGVAACAFGLECISSTVVHGVEPMSTEWLGTAAWVGLTSLLGAWAFLSLGKMWERMPGDGTLRRLASLVVGGGIGVFAYALMSFLLIQPNYLIRVDSPIRTNVFHDATHLPTMLGFVTYFAALFFVLRWWKHADPLRRWRLNLFTLAICLFIALAIHVFAPIPHGFVIAVSTAFGIQLGAQWITKERRDEWIADVRKQKSGA